MAYKISLDYPLYIVDYIPEIRNHNKWDFFVSFVSFQLLLLCYTNFYFWLFMNVFKSLLTVAQSAPYCFVLCCSVLFIYFKVFSHFLVHFFSFCTGWRRSEKMDWTARQAENIANLTRTTLLPSLKGQSHEIFDPRFFSLNGTSGSFDSWAKAVLNIDSNWRSNSIRFFWYITPNLKFYFTAMGQERSPMTDFLIDCYFNGFCKGRKNFVSTPRFAKKLRAMQHSGSRLRAMRHSAESILVVEL
jgi:hypothetical protein